MLHTDKAFGPNRTADAGELQQESLCFSATGAGNPAVLSAYTFLPRKRLTDNKLPLIVLVHGGIHGNFDGSHAHILHELLQQGYAILAPEYRGSSGYGKDFWQLIDYGGLEVKDVFSAKQWMLEKTRWCPASLAIENACFLGRFGQPSRLFLVHTSPYRTGMARKPLLGRQSC
jgi:hypothetical protein